MSLNIEWQDSGLDPEFKVEIYCSVLEGCKKNDSEICLSTVNTALSDLDQGDRYFGDFDDMDYELRIFELNEGPFRSEEDIFSVKQEENYILKPPQNEFDYLILDISDRELTYFLPMVEVIASIDYSPKEF